MLQGRACGLGVAGKHRPKQDANGATSRRRDLGAAICDGPMGRQHPERFGELYRRLQQTLGGRIRSQSQAVFVACRKHRSAFVGRTLTDHRRRTHHRVAKTTQHMPPARYRIEFGFRNRSNSGCGLMTPGDHHGPHQASHSGEKLSRFLDLFEWAHVVTTGGSRLQHSSLDAIVGGVSPDHRLVGSSHILIDIIILGRPLTGEPSTPATIAHNQIDQICHARGVGLHEFEEPPLPTPRCLGRVVQGCCQPGLCSVQPLVAAPC